jgi:putative transcriptional regulator
MAKRKSKKRDSVVRLFAEKLREVRLLRGMTQAELATAAEVSVTYVSELESADTTPGIDLVARLAAALDTTVGELLPTEEPVDTLEALQIRLRKQFEKLLITADREALLTLSPILAMLSETSNKRQ